MLVKLHLRQSVFMLLYQNCAYVLSLTQINMGVISAFIKAEQVQLAFTTIEIERSVNFYRFIF